MSDVIVQMITCPPPSQNQGLPLESNNTCYMYRFSVRFNLCLSTLPPRQSQALPAIFDQEFHANQVDSRVTGHKTLAVNKLIIPPVLAFSKLIITVTEPPSTSPTLP